VATRRRPFRLGHLYTGVMDKMSKSIDRVKVKDINFLLDNWDILNMKEIMKLYGSGGIY